jgi:uncharacterized Zn-finger protein
MVKYNKNKEHLKRLDNKKLQCTYPIVSKEKESATDTTSCNTTSPACHAHSEDSCGRIFNSISDYVVHLRTHTGEKPYKCHICNQGFASFTNRVDHLRRHMKDKPYHCQHCDKKFYRNYLLSKHIK